MPRHRHHDQVRKRHCGLRALSSSSHSMAHEGSVSLVAVDVDAHIVELITEVKLHQTFRNDGSQFVETEYVFPLDPRAAVRGFTIRRGKEVVEGRVQERKAAHKAYDAAVSRGDTAALGEESTLSADVFTTKVGNIKPGETVEISISYITELEPEGEALRFVLPTAVAPRYDNSGGRHGSRRRRGAKKASGEGFPLSVTLGVNLASDILDISSPSHTIQATTNLNGKPQAALVLLGMEDRKAFLKDDFVVLIKQKEAHKQRVVVELHDDDATTASASTAAADAATAPAATGNDGKGAAVVAPSARSAAAAGGAGGAAGAGAGTSASTTATTTTTASASTPGGTASVAIAMYPNMDAVDYDEDQSAEFVFVVDRSGSMRGQRMEDAKAALQLCLRSLPEGCKFQIVSFGSHYSPLFGAASETYNNASLRRASEHVADMAANMGGTNILDPLQFVFSRAQDPLRPRQVFVFTDGEVRDTRSVVAAVHQQHKATGVRVFGFGIGKQVSMALVNGISERGGGQAEFVTAGAEMQSKVMRQLGRALQPILTNVTIDWGALKPFIVGEPSPKSFPPIYSGSRLLAFATVKPNAPSSVITLKANTPDGTVSWPMQVCLDPDHADALTAITKGQLVFAHGNAVAAAAAKARLRDLEAVASDSAKAAAINVSVEAQVACKYTSWIGVSRRAAGDKASGRRAQESIGPMVHSLDSTPLPTSTSRPSGARRRSRMPSSAKSSTHARANASVRAVQAEMRNNIDRLLSRGEKLDELVDRSASLSLQAQSFKKAAASQRSALSSLGSAISSGASSAMQWLSGSSGGAAAGGAAAPEGERMRRGRGGKPMKRDSARRKNKRVAKPKPRSGKLGAMPPPPPAPAGLVRQTSAERAAASASLFAAAPIMADVDDEDEAEVLVSDNDSDSASGGGAAVAAAAAAGAGGGAGATAEASIPDERLGYVPKASNVDQQFTSLIALQKASGNWVATSALAALVGLTRARLAAIAAELGVTATQFATLLAQALLSVRFGGRKADWAFVARKAAKWTRKAGIEAAKLAAAQARADQLAAHAY